MGVGGSGEEVVVMVMVTLAGGVWVVDDVGEWCMTLASLAVA